MTWITRAAKRSEQLMARYGTLFLVITLVSFVGELGFWYVLLSAGVDVPAQLARFGIALSGWGGTGATLSVAYALTRVTKFVKLPLLVVATPWIARLWWRVSGRSPA